MSRNTRIDGRPSVFGASMVAPVLGPLARGAARMKIVDDQGGRLRRLLILIAAFADAGEDAPLVADLACRLGVNAGAIPSMLRELARQDLIYIRRSLQRAERYRYAYELTPQARQIAKLTSGSDPAARRSARSR